MGQPTPTPLRSGLRLLQVPAAEQLGDLDGVEGGAFEELVADHPEGETVVHRTIGAEAADGTVVAASDIEGERILFVGRIIDHVETGGFFEHGAGAGGELAQAPELGRGTPLALALSDVVVAASGHGTAVVTDSHAEQALAGRAAPLVLVDLAAAGVHVELAVFPRMPHVFTAYPTLSPECDQSLSAIEAFLNTKK